MEFYWISEEIKKTILPLKVRQIRRFKSFERVKIKRETLSRFYSKTFLHLSGRGLNLRARLVTKRNFLPRVYSPFECFTTVSTDGDR